MRLIKNKSKNKVVIGLIKMDIKDEKEVYRTSWGVHDVVNKQSKTRIKSLKNIIRYLKNNKLELTDSERYLLESYYKSNEVGL